MPELPEVQTVVNGIKSKLIGLKINDTKVFVKKLRYPVPINLNNKINKSKAKILFVAISSPQKELFLEKWKSHLNANLLMGVGGTFDILSGKKNRAPLWMQNIGLEWFYRMMQEPRRMTKRYIYTNMFYMILLFKEFFKKRCRRN